jgi:uncharacterized protein YdiU (UPF0061 family)
LWNLQRLAQAFSFLVAPETLTASLQRYSLACDDQYYGLLNKRLGGIDEQPIPAHLCHQWIELLADQKLDFHWFFRQLSKLNLIDWPTLADEFADRKAYLDWCESVSTHVHQDNDQRKIQMQQVNPATIARTGHLQTVIDAAHVGNFEPFHSLCAALMSPFDEQPLWSQWQQKPTDNNPPSILSCSS